MIWFENVAISLALTRILERSLTKSSVAISRIDEDCRKILDKKALPQSFTIYSRQCGQGFWWKLTKKRVSEDGSTPLTKLAMLCDLVIFLMKKEKTDVVSLEMHQVMEACLGRRHYNEVVGFADFPGQIKGINLFHDVGVHARLSMSRVPGKCVKIAGGRKTIENTAYSLNQLD